LDPRIAVQARDMPSQHRSVGRPVWIAVWAAAAVALGCRGIAAPTSTIEFNRDIRPILSDNCFSCHGPDPGSRKAGLRLDTKAGLFGTTKKKGPTVTLGKPEESELWRRIVTAEKDDLMPPPDSHKELSKAQQELVATWIRQGAPWQPHWSFIKPERPPIPELKNPTWVRNSIDAFVLAKLEAKSLAPAPEADRRTLARRLALDLTGLPPRPSDVEAFVQDKSATYYQKYVRQLLDSPQWGEHRARYWLDAARYADTHGLHFDNYREIWPYRDWVIRAFNRNQPFDLFTIDQIAGDLLSNPSEDQLIATGFHRCNITTNEGGTIEEENLVNYARDRVETTSWVWLGLTANCAVCHDHKFDPLTSREFYSMAAFFRNTKQGGFDGNVKDSNPSIPVPSDADRPRWDALPQEISRAEKAIEQSRNEAKTPFEAWVGSISPSVLEEQLPREGLIAYVPLNGEGNAFSFGEAGAKLALKTSGALAWDQTGKLGPAPIFKQGATVEVGNTGDFERTNSFSYGAWVKVSKPGPYVGIIARMDDQNGYRGWDLFEHDRRFAVHLVNHWEENALKVVTRDDVIKPGEWQHVLVTYDGSSKAAGIKFFINGTEVPTRAEKDNLRDTIRTDVPLKIGQRHSGQVFEDGSVQDVRIFRRKLESAEAARLAHGSTAIAALGTGNSGRSPAQTDILFEYFLSTLYPPFAQAGALLSSLKEEREAIRGRSPVTHIQIEKMDSVPMAKILFRGQYDQPRDVVEPSVPAALHSFPSSEPKNRLGLAHWLMSPENPLAARVTVNRFWQEVFGVGLVKTAEDFGIMGEAPVNQELLDWLAVEFRESGWNVKQLFELMVTSATYRQSAEATPEKIEKDPANRWLSRGPRFRMDAEMIRDFALFASGTLVPKIGGPSVKPYQPIGVWEAVAMPESNTHFYNQDKGEALYRRSLYTFWKRSAPPASLEVFNAPSRETACLRRERTDTPLQALVTLNDPQFIEAARHLSEQALRQTGRNPDATLQIFAQRLLSRPLREEETNVLKSNLGRWIEFYQQKPEEANALVHVGESAPDTSLETAQVAAWTIVANQIMNLDEVLNK